MAPRRNISFRPTIFNDLVATIGFKLFIAHSKRLNYTYQVVKVYFCATIIEYLDNVVLEKTPIGAMNSIGYQHRVLKTVPSIDKVTRTLLDIDAYVNQCSRGCLVL